MNTTFSFNRLVLLLKRYFIENKQRELTYWGILILIFSILHQGDTVRTFIYVTGFIFAAKQYKFFTYTPSGMHYLLIPATHLEKLTANILLTTVYYFGMALLTYAIGNIIGTNILNLILGTSNPVSWDLFYSSGMHSLAYPNQINANEFWSILGSFTLIQAIFLFGSIYFKGNSVGKTFLSIIVTGAVLGLIQLILMRVIWDDTILNNNMVSFNIVLNDTSIPHNISLAAEIATLLLIPFFWLVSLFRLTEKQV